MNDERTLRAALRGVEKSVVRLAMTTKDVYFKHGHGPGESTCLSSTLLSKVARDLTSDSIIQVSLPIRTRPQLLRFLDLVGQHHILCAVLVCSEAVPVPSIDFGRHHPPDRLEAARKTALASADVDRRASFSVRLGDIVELRPLALLAASGSRLPLHLCEAIMKIY